MGQQSNLFVVSSLILIGLWCAVGIGSVQRHTCSVNDNINCSKDSTGYTAAVVEYKPIPIGNQSALETVLNNVREYVKLVEDASVHNVDIIVFPEYGITTIALPPRREKAREFFVTVPAIGAIPCNDEIANISNDSKSRVLYELSCTAKKHGMYIVVNLGEVQPCFGDDPECPSDGGYHFNTNVVFDRNGAVIARYRKYHLYFEPQFDHPPVEYVTFKTDFGVEFGLFTCFDIIFAHPAVELVSRGIRNFALSTAWVDELPFLMAIQAQSLWAQSNGANLLASGYHQPERGSMGSGIYSGYSSGALDYAYDRNSGTKMIISFVQERSNDDDNNMKVHKMSQVRLPKKSDEIGNEVNHFWLREDLSNYSHKSIDPFSTTDLLCYKDKLCCDLEYKILEDSSLTMGEFKLIVYDGIRTVAAKTDWFEWQVCAVVHCLNETLDSCTENINTPSNNHPKIQNITIHMRPLKTEYEGEGIAEPGLSLLDTSFNLIPHTYFEIRQWKDAENGIASVQAKTLNSTNFAEVQIKIVAIIQRIYGNRI